MGVNMYHHAEILDAICGLCLGSVAIAGDTDGTRTLRVGSNRLFAVGDEVELLDDLGGPEQHTVSALHGLNEVELEAAVGGTYLVGRNARLRAGRGGGLDLAWVGKGRPVWGPQPLTTAFPCVVVEPTRVEQPLAGGTNRALTQEYWTSVYYARRSGPGEEEEDVLLAGVSTLFNMIMSDPYLGGTCWYSQVCQVDYAPDVERALKERGASVRVVRLDVMARRSELGPAG